MLCSRARLASSSYLQCHPAGSQVDAALSRFPSGYQTAAAAAGRSGQPFREISNPKRHMAPPRRHTNTFTARARAQKQLPHTKRQRKTLVRARSVSATTYFFAAPKDKCFQWHKRQVRHPTFISCFKKLIFNGLIKKNGGCNWTLQSLKYGGEGGEYSIYRPVPNRQQDEDTALGNIENYSLQLL